MGCFLRVVFFACILAASLASGAGKNCQKSLRKISRGVFDDTSALPVEVASSNLLKEKSDFDWWRAGLYYTRYFQNGNSHSNSAFLFWSPAWNANEQFSLVADLGVSYLHTPVTKFAVFEFAGRASYRFVPNFSIEATAGTQDWTNEAGFMFAGGGGFSYHFSKPLLSLIQSVRSSGQFVNRKEFPTWQLLLGVEISLGDAL